MAKIKFTPPSGLELTWEQWNGMNQSQRDLWLTQSGYYDQAAAAQARGDELTWDLKPSAASQNASGSSGGGGAAVGSAVLAGGAKYGYSQLFPSAAAGTTAGTGAAATAPAVTAAAPAATTGVTTGAAAGAGASAGAAGASTLGAEAAAGHSLGAGAGAGASGSAGGASSFGSYVWPVAAAVTAYQSGKNYQAAKKNADGGALTKDETRTIYDPWRPVADKIPGVKQFNDAYFGHIAPERLIFSPLASGKNDEQVFRDRARKPIRELGIADPNWQVKYDDGSTFDIGKDGGYRDEKGARNWETAGELSNLHHSAVPWANLITNLITRGNKEASNQMAGALSKGAEQSGDLEKTRLNLLGVFKKLGLDEAQAGQAFDDMEKNGYLAKGEAAINKQALSTLTSGKYFTNELDRYKAQQAGQVLPQGIYNDGRMEGPRAPATPPGTPPPPTQPNDPGTFQQNGQTMTQKPYTVTGQPLLDAAAEKGIVNRSPAIIPQQPAQPARSMTNSPGFDKNGKRINYDVKKQAVNRRLLAA